MLLFPENCFNETTLAREIELGFCWVETAQGRIIAYALVRAGDIHDLLRLGVHPDHQGRGIGKALLLKVLEQRKPVILTVREENKGALRLYLRNGFRVIGRLNEGRGWILRCDPASW